MDYLAHRLTAALRDYWASYVLFAALDSGLLELLLGERRALCPQDIARKIGVPAHQYPVFEALIQALWTLGVVECKAGEYSLNPLVRNFLVSDEQPLLHVWRHYEYARRSWEQLSDILQGKCECVDEHSFLNEPTLRTRSYTKKMQYWAWKQAEIITQIAGQQIKRLKNLVDLGGGSGAYAITFCKANPELQISLVERPGVAEIAREEIRRQGFESRIRVIGEDFFDWRPEEKYEAVFISHVLHEYPWEAERFGQHAASEVLQVAKNLLSGDGILILNEYLHPFEVQHTPQSRINAALLNIQLSLHTGGGSTHPLAKIENALTELGFNHRRTISFYVGDGLDRVSACILASS